MRTSQAIWKVSHVLPLHSCSVMTSSLYCTLSRFHPCPFLALTLRTIGVKNVDVHLDLLDQAFPLALFTTPSLRTKHMEALCKAHIPELSKKIVCVVERRILRQSPKTEAFLL